MHSSTLTANQTDFAHFLAGLWDPKKATSRAGGSALEGANAFFHCYAISRHHSWKAWKNLQSNTAGRWWCQSLQEAAVRYSWPEKPQPHSFQCISTRLHEGLVKNDATAVHAACLEIFRWGGVARKPTDGSRLWLERCFIDGSLCQRIRDAVVMLRPGSTTNLQAFDGSGLLMNSAMTKVYAAADPQNLIIYDGRVGAALGLLTRYLLRARNTHEIPTDLAFRWGPPASRPFDSRDPSLGGYRFSSLYQGTDRDEAWAKLVRKTSQILKKAAKTLNEQGQSVSVGELERALFMIGYNVRHQADAPTTSPRLRNCT